MNFKIAQISHIYTRNNFISKDGKLLVGKAKSFR